MRRFFHGDTTSCDRKRVFHRRDRHESFSFSEIPFGVENSTGWAGTWGIR